jgi:hypothetical protein
VYNWLNGGYHVCASPTTISIPGEEFTPSGSAFVSSGSGFGSGSRVVAFTTSWGTDDGSGSDGGDERSNERGTEDTVVLDQQEREEYYRTVTSDKYWRDVYGVDDREVDGPEEDVGGSNGREALIEQQRDDYLHTVALDDYWTDVYRAGDREVSGSQSGGDDNDDDDKEEEEEDSDDEENTAGEERKSAEDLETAQKKLQDYSNVLMAALLGLLVGRSTADPRVLFIILGIFITECLFRFAYLKYKQSRRAKIEKK